MVWSIFQYENNFVTTTKEEINGVTCLKFKPKNSNGLLPTILNYHGWHSSKDFKRFESLVIATNGYQVIVPDALYHGDRNPINHDDPQNCERYLWEIILQNIKESKKFIQEIINTHEADPLRIAIIGDSMGAISATGIFIDNPNLKCLVGVNGNYTWQESIKINELPPTNEGNKELIKYYDPLYNEDKIKERDVLILHGNADSTFSIDTQKLFYNKLLPLYIKNPNNFEFLDVSNVNHRITTGMLERAIIWFKEHL